MRQDQYKFPKLKKEDYYNYEDYLEDKRQQEETIEVNKFDYEIFEGSLMIPRYNNYLPQLKRIQKNLDELRHDFDLIWSLYGTEKMVKNVKDLNWLKEPYLNIVESQYHFTNGMEEFQNKLKEKEDKKDYIGYEEE